MTHHPTARRAAAPPAPVRLPSSPHPHGGEPL